MPRVRRWWVVAGGLLGVGGLMGLVLWLLRDAVPDRLEGPVQEQEIARELRDFWVVLRDSDGNQLWRLFGKRVLIKKNGDYVIEGVAEGQYFRAGEPWLKVRAERGEYRAATRDAVVEGGVQVESLEDDLRLQADRFEWNEKERLLLCPQLGELVYGDYVLHTRRVLYHVDRRELECPDPIRAEGGGDLLEVPRLRADLKEKTWRLAGPGRIVHWVALAGTLALLPRPSAAQPAAPEQVQGGKKRIEISYEKVVEWRQDSGIMEGNVVVVIPEDEVTVYADRVEYDRKKELARATGNLRLVDPENTLTGKLMLVYLKERRAVVDQDVKLVHTPREQGETRPAGEEEEELEKYRQESTVLTCQKLEYFYRKPRKAVATGQVRLEQPRVNRLATAQKAFYFEETDTLRLEGDVEARDEEGQSFAGPEIEVGVEEEWVRARGPGHFVIFVEEEEEGEEAAPAAEGEPAAPQPERPEPQ